MTSNSASLSLHQSSSRWRRLLKSRWCWFYVFAAALAGFGLSIMYAKPAVSVDYRPRIVEAVKRVQGMPEGAENGWLILKNLGDRVAKVYKEVLSKTDWGGIEPYLDVSIVYEHVNLPGKGETPEQVMALAHTFLDRIEHEGVFRELNRLRTVQFGYRVIENSEIWQENMADVGRARHLTRLNLARMYLASKRGDEATQLEALAQCLALGRLLSRQGTTIEFMAGVAIQCTTMRELRYELSERSPSPQSCRHLNAVLHEIDFASPVAAFEGERLLDLDIVQRLFTDDGSGDGRLLLTNLNRLASNPDPSVPTTGLHKVFQYRVSNLLGLFMPGRLQNIHHLDLCFEESITQAKMSRPERIADSFDAQRHLDGLDRGYPTLHILMPRFDRMFRLHDEVRLDQEGTCILLAIATFCAEEGHPPSSLAELAPIYMDSIPLDLFNAQPFGYRRFGAGEDAAGRSYLLYSYGSDSQDNGARETTEAVNALRLKSTQGFDYVLNPPRPSPTSEKEE